MLITSRTAADLAALKSDRQKGPLDAEKERYLLNHGVGALSKARIVPVRIGRVLIPKGLADSAQHRCTRAAIVAICDALRRLYAPMITLGSGAPVMDR